MRKIVLTMLVVLLFCGCEDDEPKHKRNPEAERAATAAVENWLKLADSGRYAETWDYMASNFKEDVTKSDWYIYFSSLRKPLARAISRKLISARYTTSIPGVPKGEYVIIQYSTFFEKKRNAVETITPVLDKDGKWRVSGYQIQ